MLSLLATTGLVLMFFGCLIVIICILNSIDETLISINNKIEEKK